MRRRKPEPLQALNAAWAAGEIGEEAYQEEFAHLNALHGQRCACGGQAVYDPPEGGPVLCGDCALERIQKHGAAAWTETR